MMNTITPAGSSASALLQVEPTTRTSSAIGESDGVQSSSEVKFSVLGQLISASKGKEASPSNGNEDIDNSNLPQTIKDLLKRIRELQEQIREQEQKRAAIMADQSLSAEEKTAQLRQVQAVISSLNSALSTAMSTLNKAMQEQNLTKDQQASVVNLLAL